MVMKITHKQVSTNADTREHAHEIFYLRMSISKNVWSAGRTNELIQETSRQEDLKLSQPKVPVELADFECRSCGVRRSHSKSYFQGSHKLVTADIRKPRFQLKFLAVSLYESRLKKKDLPN